MTDIQRADARSRRRAILVIALVLLVGGVVSVECESWLREVHDMPTEAAQQSLTTVFRWCVGAMSIMTGLAGCFAWWWGRRVRVSLRFPLPGARVLRDTVILSGQPAASRGMLLQVLGVSLMLIAAGIVILSWWVLRTLGGV